MDGKRDERKREIDSVSGKGEKEVPRQEIQFVLVLIFSVFSLILFWHPITHGDSEGIRLQPVCRKLV